MKFEPSILRADAGSLVLVLAMIGAAILIGVVIIAVDQQMRRVTWRRFAVWCAVVAVAAIALLVVMLSDAGATTHEIGTLLEGGPALLRELGQALIALCVVGLILLAALAIAWLREDARR